MKRKTNSIIFMAAVALSQLLLPLNPVLAQSEGDTLVQKVTTLQDKISGIEERVTNAEADLSKLTKIKLSGYIQAQYQNFENPSSYPYNYFSLRRARLKVQYEPATGVAFVLQPDFLPGSVSLKDAYVQLNDPWLKTFSLYAGQFNRPNYEVEYSSSSREVAERSLVIRSLYPGERALGAKLEIAPPSVPIKVQIAVFNGNDALTINDANNANVNLVNKDYDVYKDLMARVTYGFKFGNLGGLNIGAHGYMGYTKAASGTTLNGDYSLKSDAAHIGSSLNRSWFGVEAQLYLDILGGLTLKGEYLRGSNAYTGAYGTTSVTGSPVISSANDTIFQTTTITNTTTIRPNIIKKFQGYYVYLVKNIGKKNQLAIRYDYYDPNTELKGDSIGLTKYNAGIASKSDSKTTFSGSSPVVGTTTITKTATSNSLTSGTSDIAYGTISVAWSYFFTDNIKLMVNYDIPMNEKVGKNAQDKGNVTSKYTVNNIAGVLDYSKVFPQNMLTVRLQVKF